MMNQVSVVKHWADANRTTAFWLKTALGANLIAVLAQFSIPLPFVSITGQSLAVTLVGFALGRKAGVAAVLLYLLEGVMGMPVFANGKAGLGVLMGPSGGYLIGFIAMAYILGRASDKGVLKSAWKSVAAALVATAVMFVFGLVQLSFFVPGGQVLEYGLYPFIAGGIVKAVLASVLVVPAYRFFRKF
ncbi:biotin transporter BioY [Neisseria animalis]|uniref:Biotin transporter n=1 Tax=Neisseria animalis TaxID=492 RepID=A0A5P3MRR8_NEIAN|nr:biotin transporter BioY [Neisseria animalis]QEY24228.1 biotin transporter BioY [Neisseria animalis]VEE06565.1 Biotin ECF transporter S component BioY2 [Neisseria animalis]